MKKALNTLPAAPDDAYQEIMNRIKNAGKYSQGTAFRTLAWIFHAARPLRMDELLEALDVHDAWLENEEVTQLPVTGDDYDVAAILKNCQSLVRYDEPSGIVRFAHPTVQNFLEGQDIPGPSELAMTCMTFLGFRDSEYKRVESHEFYKYALRFWALHTRGEAERFENIQRAIVRLLSDENERTSRLRATNPWNRSAGQTWLHIAAEQGLATFSGIIFERAIDRYDRYVLSAIPLKVGHIIQY